MNSTLFVIGLSKLAFGFAVGALGIYVGSWLLHRLLKSDHADSETRRGNVAAGVLRASSLIALAILVQHAVNATFDAMDLLYRGRALTGAVVLRFATYAAIHVGFALLVGAVVLAVGAALFTRLTRGVDELAEIRRGNVAPALVLAAVLIALALLTAPGLRTALDGLLPLPDLAPGELVMPS